MYCRICNHSAFKHVLSVRDVRYVTSNIYFDVRECYHCGVFITCEEGTIINPYQYYSSDYGAHKKKKQTKLGRRTIQLQLDKRFGHLLDKLHIASNRLAWTKTVKLRPGTAILDIGCGSGNIASFLKHTFACDITGIEPNQSAAQMAREKGLIVHTGVIENFNSKEQFDIVLLIHVLEHLPDPIQTLKCIHQYLKPNGRLIIALPNVNSLERKIFGEYWDGWDIPRHVHHFNSESLSYALKKSGYTIETEYYEWYSLFTRSLANKIHQDSPYHQRNLKQKSGLLEKSWGLVQAILRSSSAKQVIALNN